MRDTLRLGLILMVICAVTSGALGYINELTEEKIENAKKQTLKAALGKAFPDATSFSPGPAGTDENDGSVHVDGIYVALADGQRCGYVVEVNSSGYGGPIRLLVGLDAESRIQGVEVIEQSETPGLGTQVRDISFRHAYKDLTEVHHARLVKDGGKVQAITGATISSRAVSAGVEEAMNVARTLSEKRQP